MSFQKDYLKEAQEKMAVDATVRHDRITKDLQTQKENILQKMEIIADHAGDSFTSEEQAEYNKLKADVEIINERLKRPVPKQRTEEKAVEQWIDSAGSRIGVYSPSQKMGTGEYSVGKYLKGCLTGRWDNAEMEHELFATSTTNNAGGAYLMPSVLHSEFVDLLRANTTLVNAGARTVDLKSNSDKIARVIADPTAEVKTELQSFNPTNPTFDLVTFAPVTVGCYVQISRELLQDAENIAQILEHTFTKALGQKLDLLGLYGSGTGEPLGLLNYSDINGVTVTSWSYDTILDGIAENENANSYDSSVYITSPTVSNTLAKLKDTANNYISKPAEVAALRKLVSTNVNDSDLVLGNFSDMYLGIRSGIAFETSPVADSSFAKYAQAFRIVCRADWQVVRPKSFCLCSTDVS